MASPPHAALIRSALLIVLGLLAFAVAAILLLRCLLRWWACAGGTTRRRGGVGGALAERDDHHQAAGAGAAGAGRRHVEAAAEEVVRSVREQVEPAPPEAAGTDDDDDGDTEGLIASLPLFTTASPLAALPKNSPDCAVCLSPFDAEAKKARLRLLPACRHAFHAACVDTWLRTSLVCPICRRAVSSPLPPLPAVPVAAAAAGDQADQEPELPEAAAAKSAASFLSGGRWSQDYRRDEPWQWDVERRRAALSVTRRIRSRRSWPWATGSSACTIVEAQSTVEFPSCL